MAKDNNKQVVDNYTEASDKQKSQAKVNFEKMKERLVAVGVAALIFVIGGKIMLNSSKDDTKDSNNEYTVESNTEDEIPEINTDEIVDEAIEEVAEEKEEVNENADEDKEATKPSNTVQQNTPDPNTGLDQGVPVQGTVVAGGGATGVTEEDVTDYPTAEEIAQATAQINNGAPVGTVLPTGQIILERTEQTTGGEYTGTYEETVSGSEHETLPDLETIDLDPGDDQIVWESSDGVQHVEDIPEGATSYQIEEIGHDEVIPDELMGLSQDELDAIAADQAEANSLDEGGRRI